MVTDGLVEPVVGAIFPLCSYLKKLPKTTFYSKNGTMLLLKVPKTWFYKSVGDHKCTTRHQNYNLSKESLINKAGNNNLFTIVQPACNKKLAKKQTTNRDDVKKNKIYIYIYIHPTLSTFPQSPY